MKNGLPYLSKDLFWEAMEDIASQTTLVTGHPWPELKEMIHEQVQKTYPMLHAVQDVVPTPAPSIQVAIQVGQRVLHHIKRRTRSCRYLMPINPNQIQIDRACQDTFIWSSDR